MPKNKKELEKDKFNYQKEMLKLKQNAAAKDEARKERDYQRMNPKMEEAMAKGKKAASSLIQEGDFGRLGEREDVKEAMELKKGVLGKQEAVMGKRQAVIDRREEQYGLRDEMIGRARKRADEGMGTEVMEAQRAKQREQLTQATQQAGRGLAGMFGGRQGAGVAAQSAGLQEAGRMGRAGIERDMFLANQAAMERGEGQLAGAITGKGATISAQGVDVAGYGQSTSQYGQSVNDYSSAVGELGTFDISQAAAEKTLGAQLAGQFGMTEMQTAASDRAAKISAEAAKLAGGGGGKK